MDDRALDGVGLDLLLDGGGVVLVDVGEGTVDQADDAVGEGLAGEDGGGHVGELLLDEAELADGFAEGFALFGVANAVVEGGAGSSDGGVAELVAADVEDVEGDVVAFADLAEEVGGGDLAVGKDERAGGAAADAELVLFLADGEAGGAFFDEEGGEAFLAGVLAFLGSRERGTWRRW